MAEQGYVQHGPEHTFWLVWCRLAKEGACDGSHGREYQRVIHEWYEAGYPSNVEEFIRARANIRGQ